jgi:ribosomal protein S18 acetylase RimI-like enzyme
MQDDIQILRASEDDYGQIYALQLSAFATEDALYDSTIPPMLQTLEEAVDDCRKNLVLKAVTQEGVVIGSVRGVEIDGECLIMKLMVDPDFRRRGIGTALLLAIEREFSPKWYELYTGSRSKDNIALYERKGYRIVETDAENELVRMVKDARTQGGTGV